MFMIFGKQRIKKIAADAKDYYDRIQRLAQAERRKEQDPERGKQEINSLPEVRYSLKEEPVKKTEVRFSLSAPEDGYNQMRIDYFMNSLVRKSVPPKSSTALDSSVNKSFVDQLLYLIDRKAMKDTDVYKTAQIDRRLFSKMISERNYKPSKDTCLALCYALHLALDETQDLLSRAGYTISHSSRRDVVLEYFFREHLYNLNDINRVLYLLGEKTLGR